MNGVPATPATMGPGRFQRLLALLGGELRPLHGPVVRALGSLSAISRLLPALPAGRPAWDTSLSAAFAHGLTDFPMTSAAMSRTNLAREPRRERRIGSPGPRAIRWGKPFSRSAFPSFRLPVNFSGTERVDRTGVKSAAPRQ
jgi:hypothetical protein